MCGTDLYRRLKLEQDRLRDENFSGLGAQVSDLRLQQLHLLARPAAPHLQEPVYDGVQIHLIFRHSWDLLLALGRESKACRQRRTSRGVVGGEFARETLCCCPAQGKACERAL